jgi:hypothetical protein
MWLGERGALSAENVPHALAIECSTLSHDWVLELGTKVRERQFRYVDSPVTGLPGLNITLSTANGLPLELLNNCSSGEDCGWYGNFAPGASLLWMGGTYDGNTGWWAPNGPLTVTFNSPQRGLGFQTMADETGPFTATLCAYNASNTLLGCVPFTGNGTATADSRFIGLYDDTQRSQGRHRRRWPHLSS